MRLSRLFATGLLMPAVAATSLSMAEQSGSDADTGVGIEAPFDTHLAFSAAAMSFIADPGAPEMPAGEQPPAGSGISDLAQKLANPIADLVSIPFQFNYDEGFGPKDAGRVLLNIQPVIPFSISEDWNLITRTIIPVIYQDSPAQGLDSEFGLGDVTQSFFFSPKKPVGGWIIGGGPVVLWPTGTEPELRNERFGLGPTIVALRQEHGWTYGALVNHLWSVTDSDDHDPINATFFQPFLSYTWPTATTITFNTEATYDWHDSEWTVPLNLMLSQILKLGAQPISLQVGGRYYADSPGGGPEWGLRFALTLMFPK